MKNSKCGIGNSKSKIQNSQFSLPRYPRYKDSGVEWLGEVPEHWDVQSLRAVAGLYVEKNQPDLPVLSVYREYGVIPKDSRDDNHNATSLDTSNYKVVRPGDLAVNKMKAWQGSLGVSEHHGIVSPAYITCRLNQEKVTGRYIHYLLRSKTLIGALDSISYGVRVGQWDMRFEDFKKVGITIPPKPEQDRIVAFLDQKTAEIDALIAKKQRQIELLDEQKAILINRAVTRGIVNVEFGIRNEYLSSSTSSHSIFTTHNSKFSPSGIEWIGEIPEHWDVKKLRWLLRSSVKNGVSPPISEKGKVPTLSIAAVKNGQVTFGENVKFTAIHKSEAASYLLREGDVLALRGNGSRHLVATAGIVGSDAPEGCIYPDLLIRIQPTSLIAAHYLVIQLNGVLRDGINLTAKTSAGIWKVSGESLSAQKVLLPPPVEQTNILAYVDSVQEKTAVCKSGITREIESLKTLRSTLIAHAVTGRIKV
jgi:type I restriction enzyme S subunit